MTSNRYVKKPIIIEAYPVVKILMGDARRWPQWVKEAFDRRVLSVHGDTLVVKTIEGNVGGHRGDMVIQGVHKELYPCEGSIFEETYEQVE